MEKLKQYWLIIVIVLVVFGGLFYWFQWRPSQIRKECSKFTLMEKIYESCLRERGLEK